MFLLVIHGFIVYLIPPLLVWQGALDLGYLFYSEDCPKEGKISFPGIFRKMKIILVNYTLYNHTKPIRDVKNDFFYVFLNLIKFHF